MLLKYAMEVAVEATRDECKAVRYRFAPWRFCNDPRYSLLDPAYEHHPVYEYVVSNT